MGIVVSVRQQLHMIYLVCQKNTFISIERQIGKAWEDELAQEMIKAGQEEKKIAIEKEEAFEGVPAISVTVDGGWSKRSHKHLQCKVRGC